MYGVRYLQSIVRETLMPGCATQLLHVARWSTSAHHPGTWPAGHRAVAANYAHIPLPTALTTTTTTCATCSRHNQPPKWLASSARDPPAACPRQSTWPRSALGACQVSLTICQTQRLLQQGLDTCIHSSRWSVQQLHAVLHACSITCAQLRTSRHSGQPSSSMCCILAPPDQYLVRRLHTRTTHTPCSLRGAVVTHHMGYSCTTTPAGSFRLMQHTCHDPLTCTAAPTPLAVRARLLEASPIKHHPPHPLVLRQHPQHRWQWRRHHIVNVDIAHIQDHLLQAHETHSRNHRCHTAAHLCCCWIPYHHPCWRP
jgi:hypothetical protein